MSHTREDYERYVDQARRERTLRRARDLQQIAMGAVAADKLVGDPVWDALLRIIADRLERAERNLAGAREALGNPTLIEYAEVMAVKLAIAKHEARIEALREVMDLPADLKSRGKQAAELLAEVDAPVESV